MQYSMTEISIVVRECSEKHHRGSYKLYYPRTANLVGSTWWSIFWCCVTDDLADT